MRHRCVGVGHWSKAEYRQRGSEYGEETEAIAPPMAREGSAVCTELGISCEVEFRFEFCADIPVPAGSFSGEKRKKMAAVYLSQKQSQILKLAQEGNSAFYMGSAEHTQFNSKSATTNKSYSSRWTRFHQISYASFNCAQLFLTHRFEAGGHTHDPSTAIATGVQFSISYPQGNVAGSVVWDKVEVGRYSIENQALPATDTIANEPISSGFSGILGLALLLSSIIAEHIPRNQQCTRRRCLGIECVFHHPHILCTLRLLPFPLLLAPRLPPHTLSPRNWTTSRCHCGRPKVSVRTIAVGSVFPTAVLDSGVPLILTTQAVAKGIYGVIGISPAIDGQYYVPCAAPLNMTIALDNRPEIPIHPLDLTAEPPKSNQAQFCIGLIQPADVVLGVPNSAIGNMILSVPSCATRVA
ncbi:hypothetical protein Hypma_006971 [Hypsizygus marmoreus]|uniref:Peptidase A1 domain-containing protein n=1 Tax=Hypsizygus marmoreus TaxID=39966 RepID=A0A369K454_HYPMA|nr:hypothetical protein Hypma_006971 [Hypsizygus marmoreus]